MLAVYVNKDNPIKKLTLAQVDAIFSQDAQARRRQGHQDLGRARPHRATGRTSRSASTAATRPRAPTATSRSTRSPRATTRTRSRSSRAPPSVVQGVTEDKYAIGYSGIGYKTADVKAVPLAAKDGGKCIGGRPRRTRTRGKYPLSRFLYVYVNKAPNKPLDPLRREFIKFRALAGGPGGRRQGRLLPRPASIAKEELSKIQ